jgi:hypothetical protein
MYSGYLRGCAVVPHLPERCVRQYGFLQYIPPPPPPSAPATAIIDSDWIGYNISVDQILQATRAATYPAEATDDYLPWYYTVSHPILCRLVDGPHGVQPVPQYVPVHQPAQQDDPITEDAPARDAPRGEHYWRHETATALERYITQIDAQREDDAFYDLFMALDICQGVEVDPDHYVP